MWRDAASMPCALRLGEIRARRAGRPGALHAHHLHPLRALQERHGEGDGARGLGRTVPGDQHALADARRRLRRRHQHRPAAFEQGIFQRRLRERGRFVRMFHHDEIEDAADRSHHRVLPAAFLAPFGAHARCCRPGADPVPAHHRIEQGMRLFAAIMALALEGAVDLGGDRKAHLTAEHHGVFAGQGVEAGDAAAEALRHQNGGFQHRAGIAVADHRQDRLHRGLILRSIIISPDARSPKLSGQAFQSIDRPARPRLE